MSDIAQIGFAANTNDLVSAKKALDDLPPATSKAERGVTGLNSAFTAGKGAAQKFMASITGLAEKTSHTFKELITSTFGQLTAMFAAERIIEKIEQTAESLDQVSKAARAVGSSVASMQALAIAGNLAGVSTDAIAMATRRMNRVLGDAIAKGTGTKGVFERLGVSAKQLAGLPVDKRFALIADQMQKLHFSSSDAAAALALLGDRGGQLTGLLGQGGDEIRKAAGDVDRFGLALTNVQGKNIEDMNDNFMRLGLSIQGAFNQFVATIAPAASAAFGMIANGIAFVVKNIGILGTVFQIIAPALALTFGPAIIAAVWGFANAITAGAVKAVFSLAAAIALNPLGALILAIVTLVTAIWTFRDQIKKVFGIDVVQIVHDVANTVIRAFMIAYATIQDIWNNFPAVISSAFVGAVNAAIDGLNMLIQKSIDGLNTLINMIPEQLRFGMGPIASGTGQLAHMTDTNAAANAASAKAYQDKIAAINQTDYVKQLQTAMTATATATDTLTTSTDTLGSSLDGISAPDGPVSRAKGGIDALKTAAQQALEATMKFRSDLQDALSGALKSFVSDMNQGKSAVDALNDALGGLADKLLDMVENSALSGIFGALMPGGSGGGTWNIPSAFTPGGFYPGLPQANGGAWYRGTQFFANGGVVNGATPFGTASGMGVMGEAGPEAIMPLHRAANGGLGVMMASNQNYGAPMFSLNVIIQNNAANDVDTSVDMTDDGQLIVMIDKANAKLVSDSGSRTNKALGRSFGIKNATVKR